MQSIKKKKKKRILKNVMNKLIWIWCPVEILPLRPDQVRHRERGAGKER